MSVHFIASCHGAPLRIQTAFATAEIACSWMSEATDLWKEKNLLGTRIVKCQNGGALSGGSGQGTSVTPTMGQFRLR